MKPRIIPCAESQHLQLAEFYFEADSHMYDVDGVDKALFAGGVFPVFTMPPGARVLGGNVEILTAFTALGSGKNVTLGDTGSATKFLTTPLTANAAFANTNVPLTVVGDRILATFPAATVTAGWGVFRIIYATPRTADKVMGD